MTITSKQIAEWRAEKDNGMISAVGEYTPDEFWTLLDELERLQALLARYRDETPLGHQPHMIAHEVDEALGRAPNRPS